MKNYTAIKDKALRPVINTKIQNDLDMICSRVKSLLGSRLHSILLCGGFGRGEGSVTVDNGKVHIVNDYDFTIVLNSDNPFHYLRLYKKFHGPMENLARELADELNIKQVDLSLKPLVYFTGKHPLKIENYEVKQGHILLYGPEDPAQRMPAWASGDIPLFEGTWLFRNRGAGLLLAALYFLPGNTIPESKRKNFIVECTKAQLAMGDSVLLLKKGYHHLYQRRLEIAGSLDVSDIPQGADLMNFYRQALRQKLYPEFDRFPDSGLIGWWYDIRQAYEPFLKFYEEQRLGRGFDDWKAYGALNKPEGKPVLKTLAGKVLKSKGAFFSPGEMAGIYQRSKPSFSIALVALVLFSIDRDGYDTPMMEAAARMLNIELSGRAASDWVRLARGVLNEIHPGGEAGKVLTEKQFSGFKKGVSEKAVPGTGVSI